MDWLPQERGISKGSMWKLNRTWKSHDTATRRFCRNSWEKLRNKPLLRTILLTHGGMSETDAKRYSNQDWNRDLGGNGLPNYIREKFYRGVNDTTGLSTQIVRDLDQILGALPQQTSMF